MRAGCFGEAERLHVVTVESSKLPRPSGLGALTGKRDK